MNELAIKDQSVTSFSIWRSYSRLLVILCPIDVDIGHQSQHKWHQDKHEDAAAQVTCRKR